MYSIRWTRSPKFGASAGGASPGIYATPEQLETLRQQLDLDKPIYVLYVRWLGQIIRGDFGVSLITKAYVSTLIGHSLSIILQLTAVAMVMVLLIAFPAGTISAVKRNSASDMLRRVLSLLGISMPNFWLALLFITCIAVGLGWFPPGGYVSPDRGFGPWLQSLILPALSIAAAPASALSRMVRASMLDVLSKDYIRRARAKGQRERWIVLSIRARHSQPRHPRDADIPRPGFAGGDPGGDSRHDDWLGGRLYRRAGRFMKIRRSSRPISTR